MVFGGGGLLVLGILPVAAKWILIGRWKPRRIRAWSLAYVRFWIVKTMVVANPMARMFVGTPLYVQYLRALGARIGPGAAIFTQHVPVCTDLLTIGAGSVIRKDTFLSGYRARAGVIETGAITVGRGAFVGERTVIDIDTAVRATGRAFGHASGLLAGQAVPAGACWHGSPAQPAEDGWDYQTVPPARCGAARRAGHSATRLLLALAVAGPVTAAAASLLVSRPSLLGGPLGPLGAIGDGPVLRGGGHRGGRVLRRRGGRAGHGRHRSPAAEPGPETGSGVPPVRAAPRAAARRLPAVEYPVLHRPVR